MRICLGNENLNILSIAIDFLILLPMWSTWFFQDSFLSTSTQRNVTTCFSLRTIFWREMFNLRLPLLLEKSIEWVFDRLIANLFYAIHVITLFISAESVLLRWLTLKLLNKILVSSAKCMNFNKLEQFSMSFI